MENYYAYKSEGGAREKIKRKRKNENGKMYPSEMRLLLVTPQIKSGGVGRNYYYRCENVEGNTHKAGKRRSKLSYSFKEETLCQRGLPACLLAAHSGTGGRETFYDYYTDIIMLFSRLV